MSSPRISSASSSSSPVNEKGKYSKQSSSSAFKRLCQKLSPKQTPRNSTSSSPSSSLQNSEIQDVANDTTATSPHPHAFNEELIRRVFNYFDEDEDGKITPSELRTCMTVVGGWEMSLAEAEMAVATADTDNDGMLGLEEFGKLLEGSCGGSELEKELKEAFEMYAAEGTSSITAKSLKRMLSRLGQSTSVDNCKAMICKFDLNGDGVLNFDEFRVMMH